MTLSLGLTSLTMLLPKCLVVWTSSGIFPGFVRNLSWSPTSRLTSCLLSTTAMYYGRTVPSTTLLVSNPFSTMLVVLPSIALISPLPLSSGMILVFLHFVVVGSFILLNWLTDVIIQLLLPISHPSFVSTPTTTTHGQKLLSTFLWSLWPLGKMHLHTLVHPCGALYQLHYVNLDHQRNSQELHIITLTDMHDPFVHLF